MRFSIVGAGALGTILGAHLIKAGHEVRMVARGQRAEALRAGGLRVRGLVDMNVPCTTVSALDPAVDNGVLVYAVKTYHMAEALGLAQGIQAEAVFSLANGVQKNEQLTAAFAAHSVLGCMANFSGELHDNGEVSFTRNVCLYLGGDSERSKAVVEVLNQAGIVAAHSNAIESVEWSKFVGWVAFFAVSIICRCPTGVFLTNPRLAAVVTRVVREAAAIAEARGIALLDQSPMPAKSVAGLAFEQALEKVQAVGREFLNSAPNHRMSSLQDLEAGRALEVHETLGYAVREAERLALSAPTLTQLYEICAGLNELPR